MLTEIFTNVTRFSVYFFIGMIFWLNYKIFKKQLIAFLWSVIIAMFLEPYKDSVYRIILIFKDLIKFFPIQSLFGVIIIYYFLRIFSSTFATTFLIFVIVLVATTKSDKNQGSSLLVLVIFVLIFIVPLIFILIKSAQQSTELGSNLRTYFKENPEILSDLQKTAFFQKIVAFLAKFNVEVPKLTPTLVSKKIAPFLQAKLFMSPALSIFSNFFSSVMSFYIFFIFTLYLLQEMDKFKSFFQKFSPFCQEDNQKIGNSIRNLTAQLLKSTTLVAFINGAIAFFTFKICGLPVPLVLASLNGFITALPVIAYVLVWGSASLVLFFQGRILASLFIAIIHSITTFVLSPIIRSTVPGGHLFFSKISLFFGIAAFGIQGAFFGPFIVGLTITFLEIFQKYQSDKIHLKKD
eukprot:Anaeramoba_ignava/a611000_116.p1 GENE.a611000_116~~a611000_116.p1  ORF type:complete len:422 (-),score=109.03 a611000_116:182-1402(-)